MFPLSAAIEISYAESRPAPSGAGALGICVQLAPPSVVRQMPPPLTVRKSSPVVAMIVFGSAGTNATAFVEYSGRASTCRHVAPRLMLRKRPPDSDATKITSLLAGFTLIVRARPPLGTSG